MHATTRFVRGRVCHYCHWWERGHGRCLEKLRGVGGRGESGGVWRRGEVERGGDHGGTGDHSRACWDEGGMREGIDGGMGEKLRVVMSISQRERFGKVA